MDLFPTSFRETVLTTLGSEKEVLGVIMVAPHLWANMIKIRPEVRFREVAGSNCDRILTEVNL